MIEHHPWNHKQDEVMDHWIWQEARTVESPIDSLWTFFLGLVL